MYSLEINFISHGQSSSSSSWMDVLEVLYYITQIFSFFALAIGLAFTVISIRLARKNLRQIEIINRENNEIQINRGLQARLIELSHEWNSRDFIEARNKAAVILQNIPENTHSIYDDLVKTDRIGDWIYISMVAHFFIRLSSIQKSGQIDKIYAEAEFKEAIEYWIAPLIRAYQSEPSELRLRSALVYIHNVYNSDRPYGSGIIN